MSTTGEDLKQRCERVHSGLGQAIEWVEEVRSGAPRLERDGDGLVEKLRRSRNLCRRLGAAAMRPLSIGVFGMSQAGKSYLVSSLARGAHGHLFTELEGHRFNFIGHINPPGGGKEATGLVTRFTRRAESGAAGLSGRADAVLRGRPDQDPRQQFLQRLRQGARAASTPTPRTCASTWRNTRATARRSRPAASTKTPWST